jgi:hypothetical protein
MHWNNFLRGSCASLPLALLTALLAVQPVCAAPACSKVVLEGAAGATDEWKASIGEGWIFRIVPVPSLQAGYTGWDLVVDRQQPAGFPDALYLATPPFGSINEREIATTFGLRAQDAIGWNPRSFRFLIDPKSFHDAQQAYRSAYPAGSSSSPAAGDAAKRLLELQKGAASGELRILDAHLVPGTADPAPFAQQWALAATRTPHEIESSANGEGSPRGALHSMRFRLTIWLPAGWVLPAGVHATRGACGQ